MDNKIGDISANDIAEKDILELAGLGYLPEEEKSSFYEQMLATIRIWTMDKVDSLLSSEDQAVLKYILEKDAEDNREIENFLKQRNVDIEQITIEESFKYKVEFLSYAKMIKEAGLTLAQLQKKINQENA